MKLFFLISIIIAICQGQLSSDFAQNLNAKIQDSVARLNKQIQENVRGSLANVDRLKQDISKQVGKIPPNSSIITNNGQTVIVNNSDNGSKTVYSGTDKNGNHYYHEIQEKIIDGTLYRTERIYNPKTQKTDEYKYTQNLNDPKAPLVPIK